VLRLRARRVANRAKTTSRVQQYSLGFATGNGSKRQASGVGFARYGNHTGIGLAVTVALGRAGHDVYATVRTAAPRWSPGSISANGVSSIIKRRLSIQQSADYGLGKCRHLDRAN